MPRVTLGDDLAGNDARHADELRERIGGKGLGLVRLLDLRLDVPPFFVIETDGYDPDGNISEELRDAVRKALLEVSGPVAVRSSAVAEDGETASFAGQLESYLGVEGDEAVFSAIRKCWASGDTERVRAYRKIHGIGESPVAVVVQQMIDSICAGVMFSTEPDNPDALLISAGWGLGEGVVQGSVPCDTWHVNGTGDARIELAVKDSAVRIVDGAPREVEVESAQQQQPCLTDAQLDVLAREGRRLEAELGRPQDVEFAVDNDGHVWFLQVRAVTVPIPKGKRLLWDNSNIVESFSGPTTPMTYSFASHAYTIIYQLFCSVMGVPEDTIRSHSSTFDRMIGLIRGRVYYNLNAWYLVIKLLPGFRFNRGFMEQMMGVSDVAKDEDVNAETDAKESVLQRTFIYGPQAAWLGIKLLWRYSRLDRDIAAFRREFDDAYHTHRAKELDALPGFELVEIYADLERRLLWAWTPPIINDFFVMIFYGVLRKQCQKLTGDKDTNLHNELLAGEGGLESTEPTIQALHLADTLRKRDDMVALFASDVSDAEIWARVNEETDLVEHFATYIDRYGDRCVDELKLETLSLRQRPDFLVSVLRNYLRGDPIKPDEFGTHERKMRAAAEERAKRLRGGLLFRWVLKQARKRVKERENLRFARTRIFGLVRGLVRAMGRRLVEAKAIDTLEDVFWLDIDEVLSFIRGTAISTDLRPLVEARRIEFEQYNNEPGPPERFYSWGPVYVHNRYPSQVPAQATIEDGRMVGLGCYPGVVEKPVRVLEDPGAGGKLDGEILVAKRTDPGWVPLFPSVSGILVERGSLLSHSAVVAREMGIPTIVGLRGVTEWVSDGDVVRMDGSAGTVERIE